jgi:uncharacterized protein HemX
MNQANCFRVSQGVALIVVASLIAPAAAEGGGSCSTAQLVAIKKSRSLVAEADFSAELYERGKTTSRFNRELLKQANDELESARKSLQGNDEAIALIDAAQSQVQSGNGVSLRAIADKLIALERANGQCS